MTCRSADPGARAFVFFGIRVVGFGIVGMEDQPMVWWGGMYSAYCVVGEMLNRSLVRIWWTGTHIASSY